MTTVLPISGCQQMARVRGQRITVTCPDWCVTDHSATDLAFIEDLSHEGARIAMQMPSYPSGTEQTMIAYLAQRPFTRTAEDRAPRLALEAADDADAVELDAALAQAVALSMRAHADRMLEMSKQLA